jgi:hypothetical protein
VRGISLSNWIAILTLASAALVWAVRVEARVDGLRATVETIERHHRDTVEQLRGDVAYIRQRLDQVLAGGAR